MKAIQSYFRNPHFIFLVDGTGALLSAILLTVLTLFPFSGMPSNTLLALIAVAALFAIYSFSCRLRRPSNWRTPLRIIAVANLCYCCLTIAMVITWFDQLTLPGLLYFSAEVLVILFLSVFELHLAAQKDRDKVQIH